MNHHIIGIQFIPALSEEELIAIQTLAKVIWKEHYQPIIGLQQVEYMLDKFQSVEAMQSQILDGYYYFQICSDQALIGYLAYKIHENELFLSKIYLSKDARGKGYARTAINFLEGVAKQHSLFCIQLTVNKNNTNTIAAYEKIGFIKKEAVVMDIGNGFVMDDFVMEFTVDQ
ncbi:MAG: GNAT family N-acetyltransferase [Kangiellaceae bacterium]|nr:GNAT family N-acetyltransferase [Kangiellaceae bacterium]